MNRMLHAEARKLRSVPDSYWLAAGAIAFAVITVAAGPRPTAELLARPIIQREFVIIGLFVRIFIALIGVRSVTDEYQHGTIVPTFIASPSRRTVVLSKALVTGAVGAVVGGLAMAALLLTAVLAGKVDTAVAGLAADAWALVGGSTAAGALWAAVGVAVGFIVRHSVAATVGTVLWLLLLEDIVRPRLGELGAYLPGNSGLALAMAADSRLVVHGLLTLGTYAVVGLLAGMLLAERRDVT